MSCCTQAATFVKKAPSFSQGPINNVNRNICRTCFDLKQYACGIDLQVVQPSDVYIIVRRAGLGTLVCENFFANIGCNDWIGPKKRWLRVPSPGIRYGAINRDANGNVCFLWDSKFLEGQPGRWNGELYVCDHLIAVVRFQLGSIFQLGGAECVETDVCPPSSECPPPKC